MNSYSKGLMDHFGNHNDDPEMRGMRERLMKEASEKYEKKLQRKEKAMIEYFTVPDFSSISSGGSMSWWFNRSEKDVTIEFEDERYNKYDLIQSLRRLADYLDDIETYKESD